MNRQLPIYALRDHIVKTVRRSPVTIIQAETGAGKSTQIPQYLFHAGMQVVIAEPRRVAARSLARRVAEELHTTVGDRVGVHTAVDREYGPATHCLFCTDGIGLIRHVCKIVYHDVLIIDEVHEWNLSTEVLLAWAKAQLAEGTRLRFVLMSATLDTDRLAAFFGGAEVIGVPGRTFPVEDRRPGESVIADAVRYLSQGRNVLIFEAGKGEILYTMEALHASFGSPCVVLPLHGDLSAEAQQECFARYDRPKCIVSTNIAQTSVTIDDIDVVIDRGVERTGRIVNGISGLYYQVVSQEDKEQRRGRAGRTRPGIYIDHCKVSVQERPAERVPRILQDSMRSPILLLMGGGYSVEKMRFFHQPPEEEVQRELDMLRANGCLTKEGKVSSLGEAVAKIGIDPLFARIVVECETPSAIQDGMTLAALLECGGHIVDRFHEGWRELCEWETESELLAHLAVFRIAQYLAPEERTRRGIIGSRMEDVQDVRRIIAKNLGEEVAEDAKVDQQNNRAELLRAIKVSLATLLFRRHGHVWVGTDGESRLIAQGANLQESEWVIGVPWDLEVPTAEGSRIRHLILYPTCVEIEELMELRSDLVERRSGVDPFFDAGGNTVMSKTQLLFNGMLVKEELVSEPFHDDAPRVFRDWWVSVTLGSDDLPPTLLVKIRDVIDGNRVVARQSMSRETLEAWFDEKLCGAISFDTISYLSDLQLGR